MFLEDLEGLGIVEEVVDELVLKALIQRGSLLRTFLLKVSAFLREVLQMSVRTVLPPAFCLFLSSLSLHLLAHLFNVSIKLVFPYLL